VTFERLQGTDVLVLNTLQRERHISHFNLTEALETIQRIAPRQTYLTHMSHRMGLHAIVQHELPASVALAYDGLQVDIAS
jgi:phosphoribosyl 1,2-cyclic phosphate phosphodiesterase